ncbi:MAG: NAD(P)H-hydrate dehydratase [Bacteroidales bacterium]
MKILQSAQVKEVDKYTIENEPIHSINLMERAAGKISGWISRKFSQGTEINIFVGPGNNGGDGLAIGRQLADKNYPVNLYLVKISDKLSPDAATNLERLKKQNKANIYTLEQKDQLPKVRPGAVILDGLFGSGLNRPLEGFPAEIVKYLNQCDATRIAIDIPSGLFGEDNSGNNYDAVFRADYTLTFQFPSISFFFPEHEDLVGKWYILPIGLDSEKIEEIESPYYLVTKEYVKKHLKKRKRFDHKGRFGHILMITGGYGKMGAAVLASKAALKTGAGLVTTHIPKIGYQIMQTALPEAMISLDVSDTDFSEPPELDGFTNIGTGPGLGTHSNPREGLRKLIEKSDKPLVLDADALNILSLNKEWLRNLPAKSILTPHPKEFERLTEPVDNQYSRIQLQREFAGKYDVYLVLKGGNTTIATPEGNLFFNVTGNPGMATGGSGDVLTGMITSLLGQGYEPGLASVIGVYLHGLAGDLAVELTGEESLIASDMINSISNALKYLKENEK